MKKLARLIESERFIETEEYDIETDEIKNIYDNKTLIKKTECRTFPENCKPFIVVSVLFIIMSTGIITYFCLKLKNNVLPYQNFFGYI